MVEVRWSGYSIASAASYSTAPGGGGGGREGQR